MAYFDLSKDSGEPDSPSRMFAMFGPGQVDQSIRQALQMCWMMLPDDKKTPEELEAAIRRIVDRAIANFRDDFETFGKR